MEQMGAAAPEYKGAEGLLDRIGRAFTPPPKTAGARKDVVRADIHRINTLFLPLLGTAVLAAGWLGWKADATGPVLLWVFASLAAGGTVGFLFGIPKSGSFARVEPPPAPAPGAGPGKAAPLAADTRGTAGGAREDAVQRARPNTNLEEISDWLTKIIVGLTLVNLKDIKTELGLVSVNAAAAIRGRPTDADVSAAMALIVGFSLMGFLLAYLYMRLFVQGAIVRSDGQMQIDQYLHTVAQAERVARTEPEPVPDGAQPAIPSPASVDAARDVAKAAPPNRPELVLEPLRQLAAEYTALRQESGYSPERTRAMARIVQRMRPLAIAAAPYIEPMMKSASPGDHLVATVIMQMNYMPEHMEWLARRLVEERAFIGYQAASALLARKRVAGPLECRAIDEAVSRAKQKRAELKLSEATLDRLIDEVLATQ